MVSTKQLVGGAVVGAGALLLLGASRDDGESSGAVEALVRRGPDLSARYATIKAGSSSTTLTGLDLLWAGRMVLGEGGSKEADLWAMAQRSMLPAWQRSSFTTVIRKFAQPINPKWYPDGICCAEGATGCPARPSRSFYCGSSCEPGDRCSPQAFARRARISGASWSSLPESVRRAVARWALALTPNPAPRAVNWGSRKLVTDQMARAERVGETYPNRIVLKAGNWYLDSPVSRSWPADYVTMSFEGRTVATGGNLMGALILGGSLAAAGWIVWKVAGPSAGFGSIDALPRDTPRCDKPMSVYDAESAWAYHGRIEKRLIEKMSERRNLEFLSRKKAMELRLAYTGETTGPAGRRVSTVPEKIQRMIRQLNKSADSADRDVEEMKKDLVDLRALRSQCLEVIHRGERGPIPRRVRR